MNRKNQLALVLVCLIVLPQVTGATPESDIQARIYFETKAEWSQLQIMHLDIVYRDAEFFVVHTNQSELSELDNAGYKTEIVHESISSFYRSRLDTQKDMGGYKTLSEINTYLDGIIADHPTIVSTKVNIGYTIEGREMWAVKISDNPSIDEDEPEVMYTAAIHAREVITPEVILNFMDHVTDNYGINPEITDLVNNTEIWIVPVVNPDGYYYNEDYMPGGGGNWRKNRRDNGGGIYGVDLNRNYGYQWGYDDAGSSPDTDDPTYRGTGPFSEPETQNMRDFTEAHEFAITVYVHSYSNLILWPWGYDYLLTPDEYVFAELGDSMTAFNGYEPTAAHGLYAANGVTDDWGYGETTSKNLNWAFTFEVGSSIDGFWPDPSRIPALVAENLGPLLFLTRHAGDVWTYRKPEPPAIVTLPDLVNADFTVEWTHDDTLNPAISYELIEMQNPQITTDPCDDLGGWDNNQFSVSITRSYSAPSSFYSGSGDGFNRYIQSLTALVVQPGDQVTFQTWYDIETDWDYAYVEVSTDGFTFTPIEGNITTSSDPNGNNRGHGITGSSGGWTEGLFDLSDYIGESVLIRFSYYTDGYVTEEGFYIDDVYPHYGFGSIIVISSTIPDSEYSFTDRSAGTYYYKVRAQDAEDQWSVFSLVDSTTVQAYTNGDIDVDGVAYSIADAALFHQYILHGLSVFEYSLEEQIAQTDVDCDNITLTMTDITKLHRIILGQDTPCSKNGNGLLNSSRSTRELGKFQENEGVGSTLLRDDPSYSLVIENKLVNNVDSAWVDIVLEDGNSSMFGFQLYLDYLAVGLELLEVQIGGDFSDWHYFDYNELPGGVTNRLRIAALAWEYTEMTAPDSVTMEPQPSPKTLVRLKFGFINSSEPLSVDINFIWEECADNTIAVTEYPGPKLDLLAFSRTVYDADLVDITGGDPLYGGAAEHCGSGWLGTTPASAVDFASGRLQLEPSCCIGMTGNVDCDPQQAVDGIDLSELIDHLFISLDPVCCEPEANMDLEGGIDGADLSSLIDHLFISIDPLPDCP